ncbi:MAG: hypothetical protein AAF519_07105 [Bacteroidota bacterium]
MPRNLGILLFTSLILILSCSERTTTTELLGKWKIVNTKSRGETISAGKRLGIEEIQLFVDGTYLTNAKGHQSLGSWKLKGRRLLLESPALNDLNGKEVAPKKISEWDIFVTQGWMHWEGTSKHGHQHLKLTLKAIPDSFNHLIGHWVGNDKADMLSLQKNKTFKYLGETHNFSGSWVVEDRSLILMAEENTITESKSISLEIRDNRLYPASSRSDYYFVKKEE